MINIYIIGLELKVGPVIDFSVVGIGLRDVSIVRHQDDADLSIV